MTFEDMVMAFATLGPDTTDKILRACHRMGPPARCDCTEESVELEVTINGETVKATAPQKCLTNFIRDAWLMMQGACGQALHVAQLEREFTRLRAQVQHKQNVIDSLRLGVVTADADRLQDLVDTGVAQWHDGNRAGMGK